MSIVRIHESIHRIMAPYVDGGIVFLYLIRGDRIALVDTGVVDAPRRVLQPALAEIGLALSDVDLILNTHAHLDHAGGNVEVRRASGAAVHLHSADLPMAQSTAVQIESMVAPLRALDFPPEMLQQRAHYVLGTGGEPSGADVILSDGDGVDLGAGIELRVVHSPGHTPGSVSYYWEGEGVLFTGDAVQAQGPRLGGYPLYFDAPDYRRSAAALAKLDPRLLCLAHACFGGGVINSPTLAGEDARAFLRASVQVADIIHRAVENAVRRKPGARMRELALDALAELIYQIPQLLVRQTGMPSLAGPTLVAHIEAAFAGSYPA